MIRFKYMLLFIVLILLSQVNLYSLITSRVEGTVVDEDSGKPVEGAQVTLYICENEHTFLGSPGQATGTNGRFVFNDLKEGEFYMAVSKKGYAAIGPISRYKLLGEIGGLDTSRKIPGGVDKFFLKEGHVKHIKITLEKEAILKVIALKKFNNQTSNTSGSFSILIAHPSFPYLIRSNFSEQFQSKYLKESNVRVKIFTRGFPEKSYEIELEKGKTKTIEHIVDYDSPPIVYGTIKDKYTGEPLWATHIYLTFMGEEDIWFSITTDKDGKFYLGSVKPGKYKVNISHPTKHDVSIETSIFVGQDDRIELNKDI